MSTVKITINPSRAAVFLDGLFVGHVGEFEGARRGLLIAPGPHKIKVALPGYQTFETEINPLPKQEVELKTDLIKHDGAVSDTSLKPGARANVPPPPPQPVVPPPQH